MHPKDQMSLEAKEAMNDEWVMSYHTKIYVFSNTLK